MAFIGEHEQRGAIGTSNIRSLFEDLAGGDFHKWLDGFCGYWGISRCLLLSIFFFGLMSILWIQIPNLPLFTLEWLIGMAPVWMPIAALIAAWKVWIWYAQSLYISKIDPILLEVKMPRELVRSPRAMENALSKFWTDSGVTTFLNRVWQGQVTPFFSLELASFGGEVHFYIWCWRGWRSVVESAIYAYYPEVEIVEAEDYAMRFRYDPEQHEVFGTDWRLEPRNDAYPIRTYVDFEIDEDPKEEYKIDPFAEVLERLSTLKPTEQMWVQIIITMCRDTRHVPGAPWWKTESRYTGVLKGEIEKIRQEAVGDVEAEPWRRSVRIPQARQTELIRDIDRNMGKHPFNVVSRGVYIADPENFGSPGYTGIRWIWRPLGNPQYANQLRPRRWGNPFDWPWQDLYDQRWIMHHRRFFDAYRRRCAFHSPWVTPHNMLSTEALASMWHPPSSAITAPGLDRLPAKKAEPPMDLPM